MPTLKDVDTNYPIGFTPYELVSSHAVSPSKRYPTFYLSPRQSNLWMQTILGSESAKTLIESSLQPTSIKMDQYGNAIPILTAFAHPNELLHVLPERSFPMKELKKTLQMWEKAGIPEIFMDFKENDKKEVC